MSNHKQQQLKTGVITMKNISFFMTQPQIISKTKTQTRRFGWKTLKVGDELQGVKKCQGLKKGEKIEQLCLIKITAIRVEPLNAITKSDCIKEGFSDYEPIDFVNMIVKHYGCEPDAVIRVIDFEYK